MDYEEPPREDLNCVEWTLIALAFCSFIGGLAAFVGGVISFVQSLI